MQEKYLETFTKWSQIFQTVFFVKMFFRNSVVLFIFESFNFKKTIFDFWLYHKSIDRSILIDFILIWYILVTVTSEHNSIEHKYWMNSDFTRSFRLTRSFYSSTGVSQMCIDDVIHVSLTHSVSSWFMLQKYVHTCGRSLQLQQNVAPIRIHSACSMHINTTKK